MSIKDRASPDNFDSVLELCLSRMQSGQTLEECLQHYSEWADRLEPLLRVAQTVNAMPKPTMSVTSRQTLAYQLQDKMRKQPVSVSQRSSRRLRFNLLRPVAILAALALIFSVAGAVTVAASAGSLPGDLLYPVKRWTESVSITLTSDDTARAHLHLDWAQRRLYEFEQLDERGIIDQTLLADVDGEIQNAIILSASVADAPYSQLLSRMVALNTAAVDVVNRVRAHAPEAAVMGLDMALDRFKETHATALEELPPLVDTEAGITNTSERTATHTPRPSATDTSDALPTSTASAETLQPQPTRTPPGQGTPKGGLTKTPPGQGNQGGNAPTGQPNQDNPGGGNGNGGGDGNGNGGGGNGNSNGGGGKKP